MKIVYYVMPCVFIRGCECLQWETPLSIILGMKEKALNSWTCPNFGLVLFVF